MSTAFVVVLSNPAPQQFEIVISRLHQWNNVRRARSVKIEFLAGSCSAVRFSGIIREEI